MKKNSSTINKTARRANHFRFTEIASSQKSVRIENISLYQKCKAWHMIVIPSRPEGRSRSSTNAGRGAMDVESPLDERRGSVRQRRVVLTPRSWRLRWQQYKAHRGERVISRKAIAQGMSDVLRCPVCSCAHFLSTLRMRPRVQRASGIPCALCFQEGEDYLQASGAMRRENANMYPRHCERSEAIHAATRR